MIHIDYLANFSGHCELYYKKSLSIQSNSTHNPKHDQDLRACEVILDALEHQLINVHVDFVTQELKAFLLSEKVQQHKEELKNCGLFIEIIEDEEQAKTDNRILPHQVLLEYTKVRDQQRRSAHEDQMEQRRIILQELIHDKCTKRLRDGTSSEDDSKSLIEKYDVTSQVYAHHVRDIFRKFVAKYSSNIGTHSFLAGINEVIKKQLSVNSNELIGWTLNGSTISEANINSNPIQCRKDYMDDAVELLTAFMIQFFNEESTEKGEQREYESLYSFHIHPSISNPILMTLLREIPSKKLEARPTGKFELISSSNRGFENRNNLNGSLDEPGGWLVFRHCDIL